ncbi:MAG: 6-phosphofructokinase [Ruminococcus sp.]|nr:6-phosphofructokinase [Ruminococcus sp.]
MLRIGMLTSGGDCQALNAAMRGVVKGVCSKRSDVEIYGFQDGYKGLIYSNFKMLTSRDFSGILTRGGTILGTSRQPFKLMRVPDQDGLDKVAAMKHTYHKLSLDCLVVLGGNGTHKTANLLREEGLNVVTLPKTIDNDLWGTEMTFGFQSAVDVATDTIDRIHTTATSHSRVFIIEVMGHKVGHVTLHAGIAGGADIVLLPEIPYDIDVIADVIQGRTAAGKSFTILAVAEGAISKEDAKLSKKEYKEKLANRKYPSIAYELAEQIENKTGKEVRITVPGHTQRGGSPVPYDRVFSSRVGAKAAELILNGEYGYMVGMRGGETVKVPLGEVAGKLKYVDPNCSLIREARMVGISFGESQEPGQQEDMTAPCPAKAPSAGCSAEPEEKKEKNKKIKKEKSKRKKETKKGKK